MKSQKRSLRSLEENDDRLSKRLLEELDEVDKNRHVWRMRNRVQVVYQVFPNASITMLALIIRIDDPIIDRAKGLAHLMEHLTARFLKQQLEGKKGEISSDKSFTDFDSFQFHFSSINQRVPDLIQTFFAAFTDIPATLTIEAFEEERQMIIDELMLAETDPYQVAHRELLKMVWAGSEYSVGDPGGLIEDVEHIQIQDITDYFNRVFTYSNTVILIVGDLGKPYRVKRIVKDSFNKQASVHL